MNNEIFLRAIFGAYYNFSHVCSFLDDPSAITNDRKGICWAGGYYKDMGVLPPGNQFYTVSLFAEDPETKRGKRRKALFSAQYVVALDDVKEKLPLEQVNRLPEPSIVIKSSLYSEQWLYILDVPETNRNRLDNLQDQLIANGLAPDGKDPGQKGVTRYMRLPGGINTKAKRIEENGGVAPQCEVTVFEPTRRYKLEDIGNPFGVELDRARADVRTDGAAEVADHPVLKEINDRGLLKSMLSPGRYDITCPMVADHTDQDDSGTALFTNEDGTIGFQCHHGSHQECNAGDLLGWLEESKPLLTKEYNSWRVKRLLTAVPVGGGENGGTTAVVPPPIDPLLEVFEKLKTLTGVPRTEAVKILLKEVETLDQMAKVEWHAKIKAEMNWTKPDMAHILSELREEWYADTDDSNRPIFYKDWVYISDINQFYCALTGIFLPPHSFQNTFMRLDEDCLDNALRRGWVDSADSIDYAPKMPKMFVDDHIKYANTWRDHPVTPEAGDCSMWLDHFKRLGWDDHMKHLMQWMANTILHPDQKINHALVLASGEGCGKDFLLYPLVMAMGRNSTTVHGDALNSTFNEFVLGAKHIHFNEVEMGNHKETVAISNKLKSMIAAPPDTISVNKKGISAMNVRNICNISITSNSSIPIYVSTQSRRYFMLWGELDGLRDDKGHMTEAWKVWWGKAWAWMKNGGWKYCLQYILDTDLSDFDAGKAPAITDFMEQAQEDSKSPLTELVERLIEEEMGPFECDLLSLDDIGTYVRNMHGRQFETTADTTFGKVLSELGYTEVRRPTVFGKRRRIRAIRDKEKYAEMTAEQWGATYARQKHDHKTAMRVVK